MRKNQGLLARHDLRRLQITEPPNGGAQLSRDRGFMPPERDEVGQPPTLGEMRIIIIGGGIGGLTAALALARRGLSCEVFEAGARDRDQGAGLMLAPNALTVLRRLELCDQVLKAGFEPRAMIIARSDGRILQHVEADEWRKRYAFGPVAIHRAALHRLLVDALRGVPVHYDTAVAHVTDEADGPLTVTLAND